MQIEGMTCGSCVARVEGALRRVPGVTHVAVNLATDTATVHASNTVAPPQRTELISAVRGAGYDVGAIRTAGALPSDTTRSDQQRARVQSRAFVHAISAGVPIIALHFLGDALQSPVRGGSVWPTALQAILCTILLASAGGAPILVGGLRALVHRAPNMDLLIALGVGAAYTSGILGLLQILPPAPHFHTVAMILSFINFGRMIELRARRNTSSAIAEMVRHIPTNTTRVAGDGSLEDIAVEDVRVGDSLRIATDAIIPVDATVIDGTAAVDESAVNGEPIPKARTVGDPVVAGSLVRDGVVTISATRVGSDSTYGRIIRAVEDAQSGKTPLQRIADRVAGVFVPIVALLAVMTLATCLATGLHLADAIQRAVAVLVIACPCAMGLATPTAVLVATGRAARYGILVRDVVALEAAGRIDTMLLDKTGTLTTGSPTVVRVVPLVRCPPSMCGSGPGNQSRARKEADDGRPPTNKRADTLGWQTSRIGGDPELSTEPETALIQLAASAEQYAQHPIARAVVQHARMLKIELLEPDRFTRKPGLGVLAMLGEQEVLVGSPRFFEQEGIEIAVAAQAIDEAAGEGHTPVLVASDRTCVGVIVFADQVRDTAGDAVRQLGDQRVSCAMVTGDHAPSARSVAKKVGIARVHAECTPEMKLEIVRGLQRSKHRVAFAGDGINDAPALTAADVGITFATGTDVAAAAADITILHPDLTRLPLIMSLARRCTRVIKQNLFWAFLYNTLAIPLAATGRITPGWAAAAMMFSSISVVLNSLRLRSMHISHGHESASTDARAVEPRQGAAQ